MLCIEDVVVAEDLAIRLKFLFVLPISNGRSRQPMADGNLFNILPISDTMPSAPASGGTPEPGAFDSPDLPGDVRCVYEKMLDGMYDGVYFVDLTRKITYWNKSAERLTGYTASEAVGHLCFSNFLEHVSEDGRALCLDGCPLQATLKDGQRREAHIYLKHKAGHRVPVQVRVAPINSESGQIVGAVEIFSCAVAKAQTERRVHELETLAFRDGLTGLANRRFIEVRLEQALQDQREFGRLFGLLMIDIDHFKEVNDQYGHDAGDAVLKTVSRTLALTLRHADIAARWGGEEFMVLLADLDPAVLSGIAERCRKLIGASVVKVMGSSVHVTVSIGATAIRDGENPLAAIKRADELLYRSKSHGRNQTTADPIESK
jgi:diguanylate cyclase (GGDEF)-like protein/PAS domain S-box-containing protein